MKVKIDNNIYGKWLLIIPENRKELLELRNLWNYKNEFKKLGCFIHAGGETQHGIDNSEFVIGVDNKNE